MEWLNDPNAWIALATLTALEIVLGIDNVVFISILTGRLPDHQRSKARKIGLALALLMRVALLAALSWIMELESPLFTVADNAISGRDLILLAGGVFLIWKATREIHDHLEGDGDHASGGSGRTFAAVLVQIALFDLVFSLDSVITAVGMADILAVMIVAVVLAMLVMIVFVNTICAFVEQHPTFKMLALSFLLLIGVALVGEGLELHIPKGYIYFAMAFSLGVEILNIRLRREPKPPVEPRDLTGHLRADEESS
jgi:predicted tellurium resistance membrane protein TerC